MTCSAKCLAFRRQPPKPPPRSRVGGGGWGMGDGWREGGLFVAPTSTGMVGCFLAPLQLREGVLMSPVLKIPNVVMDSLQPLPRRVMYTEEIFVPHLPTICNRQ